MWRTLTILCLLFSAVAQAQAPSPSSQFGVAPRGPDGDRTVYSDDPFADHEAFADAVQRANISAAARNRWTARAPYPYFHDAFSITTEAEDLRRAAWFDFNFDAWFTDAAQPAYRIAHRHIQEPSILSWSYLRAPQPHGDADEWGKLTIGVPLRLPGGYIDLSFGGSWLDDNRDYNSKLGLVVASSLTLFPIWPLGIDAGFDTNWFAGAPTLMEAHAQLKLQVFRPVFLHVGWRDIGSPGRTSSSGAEGLFVGISLSFSNLRTMFEAPRGGPADGLFAW